MRSVNDPHDRLFRRVFSEPEHAAGELRLLLPAEVSARADWSTLTPLPVTFVKDVLSELRSDVLFSLRVSGREVFLYLLMEHQSTSSPLMPFRLLRYVVQIWEHYLSEHKEATRLPAVVPMVVHHSKTGWKSATKLEQIIDLDADMLPALRGQLPCFEMLLDDLSTARDEELRARSMTELGRLALFCLARAREAEDFGAELGRWADAVVRVAALPNGVAALSALVSYILDVAELPKEELKTFFTELGPRTGEAFMTVGQILREEGRREGRAEGEAKGRAEVLARLLRVKFGAVPEEALARLQSASIEQLDSWAERVLTANSIEEALS